ncbi:MAG TPA: FtsX-like permease family protein [Gemmataceae bacterium]|nr:FtsX-like permease family protein [Gemmataceae bacterium]
MLSLYRTLSLRYLRRRWSRAILIVVSIALGVAILVATQMLKQTMVQAGQAAINPLAGTYDLQISNSDFGVPRALVQELARARIPGVRHLRPIVLGRAVLPGLSSRSALLLGVSFTGDKMADNPWGLEVRVTNPLAFLPGRKAVFVGQGLAESLGQDIRTIRVRAGGQEQQLSGAGTIDAHGAAAGLGGNILVMNLADAAKVLGQPDVVTEIGVALEPRADRDEVRRRLEEHVGGKAAVRTPEADVDSVRDVMAGLEVAFSLGGLAALVVGLFLVYNALSVSVAERSPEIGILRSLGATRGQIAALFAGEAGVLGLGGALGGVPLGAALAHVGLGAIEQVLTDIFVPLEARPPSISPTLFTVAVLAGLLTSLLAALVPAIQAALHEPAAVVRRTPPRRRWTASLLPLGSSSSLIAAGIASLALRDRLPNRAGSFGCIVLIFLGLLVATPLLATQVARLLQPVSRLLLGIYGRLAADNLTRSPRRTGLVIAAVAAVVALMFETAGIITTSEDAIFAWLDGLIAADLFVTSNGPITTGGQTVPMRDGLGQQIAAMPEVEAVIPVRFQRIDYQNKIISLIAVDITNFSITSPRIPATQRQNYRRLSEPGTVLVSENFTVLYGVGAGDRLRIPSPKGPLELQVVGTLVDYTWNRGAVFINRAFYRQQFGDPLIDLFDVYLRNPKGDTESVRETLGRRWGAEHGLVAITRGELRQGVSSAIRRLYGLLYVQEAIVGIVAGLGVVTALLISVLQRRRELGLLRAIGASQGQVLRSVLAEAMLMGLIGSVIGILFGIPLEWYAIRVIMVEESGFLFPLRISWQAAGVLIGLTLVLATLAGCWPALRALRIRITEAIAYE